jgi:hypothetical protein
MDLIDIYKIFHPTVAKYTFFSAAYYTFSKINNILGHKACLNKYKQTEIIPCILQDPSGIKLYINSKRNFRKYSNTWTLDNILANDQWVIEEIGGRSKTS